MPKISVITPCLNASLFIGGCIENVISQGCDCEHIILDGGSTDDTAKIIARHAVKHPHIRWVSERDGGQSEAMNKGIGMAQAGILGFLNADDYYEPGVLNRVLEIFEGVSSPAFVVGNCNIFNHAGKLIRRSRPAELSTHRILAGEMEHPVNPAAYFYHKSLHDLCGLYEPEEHQLMDVDMILKLTRVANIYYFAEDWGNWRVHRQTKSYRMSKNENFTETFSAMMRKHIDLLPPAEKSAVLSKRVRLGILLCMLSVKMAELGEFLGAAPLEFLQA